jgi:predicted ATPase
MTKQKKTRRKSYNPARAAAARSSNPWLKNRVLVVPTFRINQMKSMDQSSLLRLNFGTATPADYLQLKETYAVAWVLTDLEEFKDKKAIIASGMGFMNRWREESRRPAEDEFPQFAETYDAVYDLFAHVPLEALHDVYQKVVREDNLRLSESFVLGDPKLRDSKELLRLFSEEDIYMRNQAREKAVNEKKPYLSD